MGIKNIWSQTEANDQAVQRLVGNAPAPLISRPAPSLPPLVDRPHALPQHDSR